MKPVLGFCQSTVFALRAVIHFSMYKLKASSILYCWKLFILMCTAIMIIVAAIIPLYKKHAQKTFQQCILINRSFIVMEIRLPALQYLHSIVEELVSYLQPVQIQYNNFFFTVAPLGPITCIMHWTAFWMKLIHNSNQTKNVSIIGWEYRERRRNWNTSIMSPLAVNISFVFIFLIP